MFRGNKRVSLRLFVVFLLCAFALAGCEGKSESKEKSELLLGFSQLGSESAWRIGNTRDIEEQAGNYGRELLVGHGKNLCVPHSGSQSA